MLNWISRRAALKRNAHNLYGSIVALTRTPALYADLHVPDTLEGRFELLLLHMYVCLERLGAEGEQGARLGQALVERFFADMDATTRQAGVGDLSVPRKMRRLAAVYSERMAAYGQAFADPADKRLRGQLAENIYAERNRTTASTKALARYARALQSSFAELGLDDLEAGQLPPRDMING